METRWVTFEELQCDKRADRAEDARRLREGLITPEELQDENSLVPMGAPIAILNLHESLQRHYSK